MARSHEIDYQIKGESIQIVEIELDPMETVIASVWYNLRSFCNRLRVLMEIVFASWVHFTRGTYVSSNEPRLALTFLEEVKS